MRLKKLKTLELKSQPHRGMVYRPGLARPKEVDHDHSYYRKANIEDSNPGVSCDDCKQEFPKDQLKTNLGIMSCKACLLADKILPLQCPNKLRRSARLMAAGISTPAAPPRRGSRRPILREICSDPLCECFLPHGAPLPDDGLFLRVNNDMDDWDFSLLLRPPNASDYLPRPRT